jgi:hypothetical protein
MTDLADAVLPFIRTRADLSRWNTANEHGEQMHRAIDTLESAALTDDPVDVYSVTHKALASAIKVIARSDDSSGFIGGACRRILELHPMFAARAGVPTAQLVKWMIGFQFHQEIDYFEIDPVAYAPALGETGMNLYRTQLDDTANLLGPRPPDEPRWSTPDFHTRFVLEWNAQRLAVYDRDVEAIIRTHARDLKVAAWFEDTARAFEEIGDVSRAIEWAERGSDFNDGHQSISSADYWCRLLAEHRPSELLDARVRVFRKWPVAVHADALYVAAGSGWDDYRDEVAAALADRPADAVTFALSSLKDAPLAWDLAHSLSLDDDRLWAKLAKSYEKLDPLAVLPVLTRLVVNELIEADTRHYQPAVRRLKKMRQLAAGSTQAAEVDAFVAELRDKYRRRPRLQHEFDRAGLP